MLTYFTYGRCRDAAAMKRFYGDLIGLEVLWDQPEVVTFRHADVQISFATDDAVQPHDGWAFQPGWALGQLPDAPETIKVPSVSMALAPEKFRAAVDRLREFGVTCLRPEPFWVGYWSFVVQDPDGSTVELSDATTPGPDEGRAH